jgi:predicted acetyltransferase
MKSTDIRIRPAVADDWEAIADLMRNVFHDPPDDEVWAIEGSIFEPERALIADDDGVVAGHAAAFTRELSIPGAVVPAAFVSLVGVSPTHRRQGLLTRLMQRQLEDVAAAGREPIAVLWASEGRIYPRYGYGLAAERLTFDIATRDLTPPQAPLPEGAKLRIVRPLDAIPDIAKVYDQQRGDRPGMASRDDRWWKYVVSDPASTREGAAELRGVVLDTPHGPAGYAIWRVRTDWNDSGPNARVDVREVVAADAGSYGVLWRFLLSIDLSRSARYSFGAVDDPLVHLVDEPRRLGARLVDSLWVRLVDVGAGLSARRYRTGVDVVFDVTDNRLPANSGRWRLTGGPDRATCRRTDDPADLACTVLELGAAYLGGPSLEALARAGRVQELTSGALSAASVAFGWHRFPQALEVF